MAYVNCQPLDRNHNKIWQDDQEFSNSQILASSVAGRYNHVP